jgi:membrane fusion protein (multidrug efflux system)
MDHEGVGQDWPGERYGDVSDEPWTLHEHRDDEEDGRPSPAEPAHGDSFGARAAEATSGRQPDEQEQARPSEKKRWLKRLGAVVLALAVVLGIAWAVQAYLYGRNHATTDDATLQGHISPVIPRVGGYVAKVLVDDNQQVEEGQLLAVFDAAPQKLAVERAQAAVATAQAAQRSAQAALANAQAQRKAALAQVQAGKVAQANAQREARRQLSLLKSHATPRKAYDNARDAAAEADAKLRALSQQVAVASSAEAQAKASAAKADAALAEAQSGLADAKLKEGYTELRAPIAGRVSEKTLETGEYVRAGTPVMAIADEQHTWVVAKFKETEVAGIRPGQPVKVDVDAYPDRTFHGKVDSIAAATGSEFALLPEDTGNSNFVKVEKRVPVKVVITDPVDPKLPLRPGMNVEVAVKTGS